MNYKSISAYAKAKGHTRYCSPLAVALTTGVDFDTVHELLVSEGYRKGINNTTDAKGTTEVIPLLGFNVDRIDIPEGVKTAITLSKGLPAKGKYLICYRGHVGAYIDGELEDWTKGKRKRVKEIYHITCKEK